MAYSLVYSPETNAFEDDVKFICSDKRVHFRFRDFNKNEHIQGFERKLIYLMEYLFNFCYRPSFEVNTPVSKEEILDGFLKSKDVKQVETVISKFIPDIKFKGLRAFFNYNKQENLKPFGEVNKTYFPTKGKNSLLQFQKTLRVSIEDFLFNNQYSLILNDGYKKDINKKFKNKNTKNQEDDFLVKLW